MDNEEIIITGQLGYYDKDGYVPNTYPRVGIVNNVPYIVDGRSGFFRKDFNTIQELKEYLLSGIYDIGLENLLKVIRYEDYS